LVVCINPHIRTQFPLSTFDRNKFVTHTAIGVEASLVVPDVIRGDSSAIRVLTMGQMLPVKGFHLAIRAFAELRRVEPAAQLVIVGDGPEKARLQRLAVEMGIAESVEFVAWLPRHDAMSLMNRADVFLFPSFEGAGMVVLEAMAHGLPVVCLDFGGPGNVVMPDCGIKVTVGTLDDSVAGLGRALATLARDRSMRSRMGAAGKQRVAQHYLWGDRHKVIRQWYALVLPASAAKTEGTLAKVHPHQDASSPCSPARNSG
jgi:glycosyltransferase involved in cell wall biosynthesis